MFLAAKAFKFGKMDGESQGGLIVVGVPVTIFTLMMVGSYFAVLRTNRNTVLEVK